MNKLRGQVPVEIDGTAYTLLYNVDAIVTLEQETGKSIAALAGTLDSPDKVEFATVRALLWAGLRAVHPACTKEFIGKLMPMDVLGALPKILEAIEAAFPQSTGGQGAANPRKAAAGTGSSS